MMYDALCAGNLTLSHALIRQAEQGVRAHADGLRIIDSDIMSCREGVALLSGSSREVDVSSLQPDKFLMRGSRVMYCDEGLLLSAVTGNESIYVTSSVFNHNNYGIRIQNQMSSELAEIYY